MTLIRFRILQKRRHLIISLIGNLCQDFFKAINNKSMIDSNFAFISAGYYRGSGGLRAYQNDYVNDNYVEPAVI